jgi:hypothetical protein
MACEGMIKVHARIAHHLVALHPSGNIPWVSSSSSSKSTSSNYNKEIPNGCMA